MMQAPSTHEGHSPAQRIAAFATATVVFCLAVRMAISWRGYREPIDSVTDLRSIAGGGFDDVFSDLIVIGLLAVTAWLLVSRVPPAARRTVARLTAVSFIFIALTAFISIETYRYFDSPLTYPLIHYSDVLGSSLAWRALLVYVPPHMAIGLPASLLGLWLLGGALSRLLAARPGAGRRHGRVAVAGFLAAVLALAVTARARHYLHDVGRGAQNAALSLVLSLATPPQLDVTGPGVGPDQCAALWPDASTASPPVSAIPAGRIRNVIVVVLESVAAKYLAPYGSRLGVTPGLSQVAARSLTFRNAYAQSPNSYDGLVSLLTSRDPTLSFRLATNQSALASSTIATALHTRGYEMAFLHGDREYAQQAEFVARQGFGLVGDGSAACEAEEAGRPGDVRLDDGCLVREFNQWVHQKKASPLFGMVWLYETHLPYESDEPPGPALTDRSEWPERLPAWATLSFERYLEAIRRADRRVLEIVTTLEQAGIADSTMLVITSDHGEEFGQHGRYGHGTNLYDESVRIPLMFYHPTLFQGAEAAGLADLKDVAPTIAGMLGFAPDAEWEGRNLIGGQPRQSVYLFAAEAGYTVALREGNRKHVWTISTDRVESYDLAQDPDERVDIAADIPQIALCAKQALADWVRKRNALAKP